jgi:hypothetical protein
METLAVFAVPVVGSIAVFTFLAVAVWAGERRKERESYYRYELGKSLAEKGSVSEEQLMELMKGEKEFDLERRKEGAKLAGLITLGVGAGMLVGLRFIEEEAIWMTGWIPFAIGVGLLLYGFLLAPKGKGEQEAGS